MRCKCTCSTLRPRHYGRTRIGIAANKIQDDETDEINLTVVYIVVLSNQSLLAGSKIASQHSSSSADLRATNPDISKVPTSGFYNFSDVVGNPRIGLLPDGGDQPREGFEIRRVYVPPSMLPFNGVESVRHYLLTLGARNPIVPNAINVIVTQLPDNLLGQAYMFSNMLCVNYLSVGSANNPGDLGAYAYGRTMTHEIGHAFGLPHTFNEDASCDPDDFPDLPAQKLPNYDAVLVDGPEGGRYCNHYKDCNGLSPDNAQLSCSTSCSGDYEMFFNFMDYGDDSTSIAFTASQVVRMRQFLLQSDIISVGGITLESYQEYTSDEAGVDTNSPQPTNTTLVSNSSSNGMSLWLTAVGAIVIVLLVVAIIRLHMTRK